MIRNFIETPKTEGTQRRDRRGIRHNMSHFGRVVGWKQSAAVLDNLSKVYIFVNIRERNDRSQERGTHNLHAVPCPLPGILHIPTNIEYSFPLQTLRISLA